LINEAGWHFTYILTDEQILSKIRHYADTESKGTVILDYEKHRRTSPAWDANFRVYPIDGIKIPKEILDNPALKQFIRPYDEKNESNNFIQAANFNDRVEGKNKARAEKKAKEGK